MTTNNRPFLTRRAKALLAVLVVISIVAIGFGPKLRRQLLVRLVLNSEAPSPSAVDELVRSEADPVPFLSRLWNSGNVVHRQLAMDALKQQSGNRNSTDKRVEALLMAGIADPDASVRETALGTLAEHKSPLLLVAAQAQLANADPQIRLLGVQYLSRAEVKQALPILIPLLDDPDLRIVATVETALKRWTGVDYGVRIAQSIPKRGEDGRETLDPADVQAIKKGIEQRKAWWAAHAHEYPATAGSVVADSGEFTLRGAPAADFALRDLEGKTVRLSTFRGKAVVLNFWTTWCTACVSEIPDLSELQKRHTNQLVVLGVSLDGVPDEHGHTSEAEPSSGNEDMTEQDGKINNHDDEGPTLEQIRTKVARVAKARGMSYRVLLDPSNSVGSRYNGGELPTNVLIDSAGNVRRRFIGSRSLPVWEAMLSELTLIPPSEPAKAGTFSK